MNDYAERGRAKMDARRQYRDALEDIASDIKSAATELEIDAQFFTEDCRPEIEENLAKLRTKLDAFERLFRQEAK